MESRCAHAEGHTSPSPHRVTSLVVPFPRPRLRDTPTQSRWSRSPVPDPVFRSVSVPPAGVPFRAENASAAPPAPISGQGARDVHVPGDDERLHPFEWRRGQHLPCFATSMRPRRVDAREPGVDRCSTWVSGSATTIRRGTGTRDRSSGRHTPMWEQAPQRGSSSSGSGASGEDKNSGRGRSAWLPLVRPSSSRQSCSVSAMVVLRRSRSRRPRIRAARSYMSRVSGGR